MERTSDQTALSLLTASLRRLKGRVTLSDAATATGLALHEAKEALDVLMNRYICRLQVTESGEILYAFGETLRRRGEKSMRDSIGQIGDALYKAFRIGFKIWITVTLVVYFVIFVIIVLLAILALLSKSDGKGGGKIKLGWIGDLFVDLFSTAGRVGMWTYATDPQGYRHRTYTQTKRKEPETLEPKKRLVQSVYDFVFGPPRPEPDPLANAKEAAAYLRESKGILTASEVVALAGCTMDEAEERFTDYLTRFEGRPEITEEGIVYGSFERLLMSGGAAGEETKVELFWNEFEAPWKLTGNSGGRDAFLIFANGFNLLLSALFAFGMTPDVFSELGMEGSAIVSIGLGWIPFIFSCLFFLVPLLRARDIRSRETARRRRNVKRRIARVVYESRGKALSFDTIMERVNASPIEKLPAAAVKEYLDAMLPELQGRLDLDRNGTLLYTFPRIDREAEAAEALRSDAVVSPEPGIVIADNQPSMQKME